MFSSSFSFAAFFLISFEIFFSSRFCFFSSYSNSFSITAASAPFDLVFSLTSLSVFISLPVFSYVSDASSLSRFFYSFLAEELD
jgi:hypothetical protein